MSPRLPTVATAFNEKVRGYIATVRASFTSTDRPLAGTRLIHPGKGRQGYEIVIKNLDGAEAYSYDTSASSFRTTRDAVAAIERLWGPVWHPKVKAKKLVCFTCKAVEGDKTLGRYRSTFLVSGVTICPKCAQKNG